MSKVGKRWTEQENAQLAKLYNEDLLDINAIAKIHERNPLGIAARLVTLKIINHILDARGHPNPELNSIRPGISQNRDESTRDKPDGCSDCAAYQRTISSMQEGREFEVSVLKAKNLKLEHEIIDLNRRIYGMCTEIRSMNESIGAKEKKGYPSSKPWPAHTNESSVINEPKTVGFGEIKSLPFPNDPRFTRHSTADRTDISMAINKKDIPPVYKSHADLRPW